MALAAMAAVVTVTLPALSTPAPAGAATANNPSSLRFGGSGSSTPGLDRVLIPVNPHNAVDVGAADFTIEFWMAGTAADNSGGDVSCGNNYDWINGRIIVDRDRFPVSGADGRDFGASVTTAGAIAFGVQNAAGAATTICTTGVNVLNGAWHHIALQRSTNGLMQIWVDGQNRALASGPTGDISYPNNVGGGRPYDPYLAFGAEKHDAGPSFPSFRGLFDEVRISASWRYGATFAPPTAPFVPDAAAVAIYHFDGTPGALCSGSVPNAVSGGVAATCAANANFPRFDASTPPWTSQPPPPPPPPPPGNTSSFHPITPGRVADTRSDATPGPLIGSAAPLQVQVWGMHGVPSGASTATINLTAVNPVGPGFLTVFPCTKPQPGTSNLNFGPGQIVANQANIEVGTNGRICVYSNVNTDVVVDVMGWWGAAGSAYGAVNPTRLYDSRPSRRPGEATTVLQVGGHSGAGIPANATAASLNLTVTGPVEGGFLTAWPCDRPRPTTSNLNYGPGQTIANVASVDLAANGTVCIYNQRATFLVVDVTGWWGPSGVTHLLSSVPTSRAADTRLSPGVRVGGGQVFPVSMPYALAVGVLNVTVTEPTQPGFLTAYPCGQALPGTSNLNYVPGQTIAASVLVPPGANGQVCLYVSGTTHVVVDVFGGLVAGNMSQQALGGNLYALQWGYTQLGAPYAAINPYRFGDSTYGRKWECPPGWGGCSKVDMHGGTRTALTGDWVYDCSGFVVAAFQRAGVNLVKLNAGWSDAMFQALPRVTRDQAIPGDLLLFGSGAPSNPTDHVGMYLGGDRMLNATTACGGWGGVCEKTVDWTRVVAVARVPLPGTPGSTQSVVAEPLDPYAGVE
jgi:hypothetical protein